MLHTKGSRKSQRIGDERFSQPTRHLSKSLQAAGAGGKRSPSPSRLSIQRHLAVLVLLTLFGALAYSNAIRNKFVYDDNFQILRNPFLRAGQPWFPLLTSDVWGYDRPQQRGGSNYYRPLQMLSYRVTAQFAGMNPTVFHLVSVTFHLLATFSAYGILWRLTQRINLALAGGVLFVLHPIHTEAVDWISALTELGCALFFFLSFYLFLLADSEFVYVSDGSNQGGSRMARRPTLVSLVSWFCFLVALMWKEMALTLPLLIAAYVVFLDRPRCGVAPTLKRAFGLTLPYWGIMTAYLFLRYQVLGYLYVVRQGWTFTPVYYILSVLDLVAKYWLKLLVPAGLNAYHVFYPVQSWLEPRSLAAAAFVLMAATTIFYGHRRFPLACFAAVWVFLTLTPVLSLRTVGMNVLAERYLYIPSLGFCLLSVCLADWALVRLPDRHRRWVGGIALVLVAAMYFHQSFKRNADWKDNFIFYSRTVEASPHSALMHNQLAETLRIERSDLDGAEQHYLSAIGAAEERQPLEWLQIAVGNVGLADIYNERGQYSRALEALDRAQAAAPLYAEVLITRGVVLTKVGRWKEGEADLSEALHLYPNDEKALNALGVIALQQEEYEQALDYFQHAVRVIDPSDIFGAIPSNNLGVVYFRLGRYAEAVQHFGRAVLLAPGNPQYHTNLGQALERVGRLAEARAELERALALAPDYAPARASLAEIGQRDH